jgi:hypothetical protein
MKSMAFCGGVGVVGENGQFSSMYKKIQYIYLSTEYMKYGMWGGSGAALSNIPDASYLVKYGLFYFENLEQ